VVVVFEVIELKHTAFVDDFDLVVSSTLEDKILGLTAEVQHGMTLVFYLSFPSDYVTNFPSDYVSGQQVSGHLLTTEHYHFFFSFIFSIIARVSRRMGCCL